MKQEREKRGEKSGKVRGRREMVRREESEDCWKDGLEQDWDGNRVNKTFESFHWRLEELAFQGFQWGKTGSDLYTDSARRLKIERVKEEQMR